MRTIVIVLAVIKFCCGENQSYCWTYHGNICKNYLSNKIVSYHNMAYLNEEITTGLWTEMIEPLQEPCRRAAEKLLCLYAFPDCNVDTALPLCHEDCIAARQLFCYKEWAFIEDKKTNGVFYKSRGHFRLPLCEELPKYDIVNNTATCTYAGLVDLKEEEVTRKYLFIMHESLLKFLTLAISIQFRTVRNFPYIMNNQSNLTYN